MTNVHSLDALGPSCPHHRVAHRANQDVRTELHVVAGALAGVGGVPGGEEDGEDFDGGGETAQVTLARAHE